ncbi:MAG: right-handed parallel beta-helix repeat-containing protein [Lentisphaerae bacterium]|nr:right-handed parallel beta-helix repeat-containing protein [Lentisphaerota bacterium]
MQARYVWSLRLCVAIVAILSPLATWAQTVRYVNASAAGAGSGLNWVDAYTNLQTAIAAAVSGDQIWVASGTYYPGTTVGSVFTLKANVALYGGFLGSESDTASRRPGTNILSVLSADIGIPGNDADNAQRIVLANAADGAVLDGFRLTKARNTNLQGGGLNVTTPITVRHCVFDDNQGYEGAAIHCESLSLFDRCIFLNSISSHRGGAVQVYGRPWKGTSQGPTFMNCLFYNNACSDAGGAMALYHCGQRILNCTFYGNSSNGGAAIYASNDADPDIYNSIFWDSGANGGGIFVKIESSNAQPIVNVTDSDVNGGYTPPAGQGTGTHVLNDDPLFVNADAQNFRLKTGSTCINSGGTIAEVTTDLDGGTRPYGSAYDMGAYEFGTLIPGATPAGLTIIAR